MTNFHSGAMLQHFVRTSDCKVRGPSLLRRCCTTVVAVVALFLRDDVNDEDEDSEESEPEEEKASVMLPRCAAFGMFELCRATK